MANEAFEEELIEMVRGNEILYKKHEKKITRRYIQSIWSSISRELGKSVKKCKKRWNALRSRYSQELRKNNELSDSNRAHIRWIHYQRMHFLKDYIKPKKNCVTNSKITNKIRSVISGDDNDSSSIPPIPTKKAKIDITREISSNIDTYSVKKTKMIPYVKLHKIDSTNHKSSQRCTKTEFDESFLARINDLDLSPTNTQNCNTDSNIPSPLKQKIDKPIIVKVYNIDTANVSGIDRPFTVRPIKTEFDESSRINDVDLSPTNTQNCNTVSNIPSPLKQEINEPIIKEVNDINTANVSEIDTASSIKTEIDKSIAEPINDINTTELNTQSCKIDLNILNSMKREIDEPIITEVNDVDTEDVSKIDLSPTTSSNDEFIKSIIQFLNGLPEEAQEHAKLKISVLISEFEHHYNEN